MRLSVAADGKYWKGPAPRFDKDHVLDDACVRKCVLDEACESMHAYLKEHGNNKN